MVVVADGEIVDFGEEDEGAGVVGFFEGEFALFLVQVPDFGAFVTRTTDNPRIVRTNVHDSLLMPQQFHDVLALPLALFFLFDFLYQQLFGLANRI